MGNGEGALLGALDAVPVFGWSCTGSVAMPPLGNVEASIEEEREPGGGIRLRDMEVESMSLTGSCNEYGQFAYPCDEAAVSSENDWIRDGNIDIRRDLH